MKKIVSLLLLLVMLALAFTSCNKDKGDANTTASGTDAEPTGSDTGEASSVDRWEALGPQVKKSLYDFQRTFQVELSKHGDAEKTSRNDKYVVGPDEVDPGTTPVLEQLVYARNKAAVEMMGMKISYTYWDFEWSKQAEQIKTVVQGGAKDAPDLFVNMISDINVATLSGVFKDVRSIPGSYFDFTTKGWMTEYMNSLSLTGDRSYILAGDYFLDVLRAMGVLPVNITMMDEHASELAPAILEEGESLGPGEKLSARFFDYVELGKWTWSTLHKLCEAIWVDSDNDGQDSIKDQLGIVVDNFGGLAHEMYIFSASEDDLFNVRPIEDESSQYNGKDWIYYSQDSTALGKIFDAVAAVYTGKGSVGTTGNFQAATAEKPGAAYHRIKFAEGTMLTAGTVVLGALEDASFQEMSQIFSVVPLPKISEDKHYNTVIHTIGDAGAINVNTRPEKARAISAFLQYCCEHSAEVRREFLEVVTKFKTTTYDQGTDRMLTLIYNSVINGRDKMIEDCVGGNNRFIIIMRNGGCEVTSSDLSSQYQACVTAKQSTLDDIIRTWYTLPKTPD